MVVVSLVYRVTVSVVGTAVVVKRRPPFNLGRWVISDLALPATRRALSNREFVFCVPTNQTLFLENH